MDDRQLRRRRGPRDPAHDRRRRRADPRLPGPRRRSSTRRSASSPRRSPTRWSPTTRRRPRAATFDGATAVDGDADTIDLRRATASSPATRPSTPRPTATTRGARGGRTYFVGRARRPQPGHAAPHLRRRDRRPQPDRPHADRRRHDAHADRAGARRRARRGARRRDRRRPGRRRRSTTRSTTAASRSTRRPTSTPTTRRSCSGRPRPADRRRPRLRQRRRRRHRRPRDTKTYYVSLVGADRIKLHATRADARSGENALDLNGQAATGTAHRLDRLLTRGTAAWVEVATVDAGGDVRILGEERIDASIIPGAASIGGSVGISGAFVLASVRSPVQAFAGVGATSTPAATSSSRRPRATPPSVTAFAPNLGSTAAATFAYARNGSFALAEVRSGATVAGDDVSIHRAEHQRLRDDRELVRLREHRRVRLLGRAGRHRPHLQRDGPRARHDHRLRRRARRRALGEQQDDHAGVRLGHRAAARTRPASSATSRRPSRPANATHRQRHVTTTATAARSRSASRGDRQQRQRRRGVDRRRRRR